MLELGLGVSWNKSRGIGFDPSTSAFISRVTSAGGTLSALEKTATNQLVVDLKAYGLWNSMKAIYPMVGASAAACAQNLKSSSFTGTFSGGWTYSANGITGNGTNAYMDTNVKNNINLIDRASHWSMYFRTLGNFEFNGYYNGSVFGVQLNTVPGKIALGLNNLILTTVNSTIGYLIGSINSSTSSKLYLNNTNPYINTSAVGVISQNLNFYIGAMNNLGSPGFYSTQQISFTSLGDNLNDTQASDFYTAVQAFQTTLSRNV
jgi:hypothetical protein